MKATNPTSPALPERLRAFVLYREEYLKGNEKGEAAIFLENLSRAFGHERVRQAGATLEQRISRRDNGGTAYADLEWKPRVLIEMKKAGRARRSSPADTSPVPSPLSPTRTHGSSLSGWRSSSIATALRWTRTRRR